MHRPIMLLGVAAIALGLVTLVTAPSTPGLKSTRLLPGLQLVEDAHAADSAAIGIESASSQLRQKVDEINQSNAAGIHGLKVTRTYHSSALYEARDSTNHATVFRSKKALNAWVIQFSTQPTSGYSRSTGVAIVNAMTGQIDALSVIERP